jgi:hypothetical protein
MNPENNLITVFVSKEITSLYKTFLETLEDIQIENNISPEKYERLRKRVLDNGNETSRKILQFIDFFDFTINKEKVEAAAKQRYVIKKIITSGPVEVRYKEG